MDKDMRDKLLRWAWLLIMTIATIGLEAQDYKNWVKQAPRLDNAYYNTEDARVVAENVLSFQINTGAWPKNINFFHERCTRQLDVNEGTIDNDATITEVRFLMRLYNATHDERYRTAAQRGVEYMLTMQYANGGWPQYWPRNDHYHAYITYNDNAMVNVMNLLRHVAEAKEPFYASTLPDSIRHKAQAAFDRGVECILRTQVVKDGRPTVWCQQYYPATLQPAPARAFELVGLCSSESVNIVLLLKSLPNPSDRVKTAIQGAMEWYEANKIERLGRQDFIDSLGRADYRMIPDTQATPQWARFYTIDDNRPFFVGRDGVMRFRVEEIEHERRNGYAWYGRQPEKLFHTTR